MIYGCLIYFQSTTISFIQFSLRSLILINWKITKVEPFHDKKRNPIKISIKVNFLQWHETNKRKTLLILSRERTSHYIESLNFCRRKCKIVQRNHKKLISPLKSCQSQTYLLISSCSHIFDFNICDFQFENALNSVGLKTATHWAISFIHCSNEKCTFRVF